MRSPHLIQRLINVNSEVIHIGRMLTCVLRHMRGISFLTEIEWQIQYNRLVNSIATVASMVHNRDLVNQNVCMKFCNYVY